MSKVYLAGPIAGFSYKEASVWRDTISNMVSEFSIICYSPLRGESYDNNNIPLNNCGSRTYKGVPIEPKNFVRRDWFDVKTSDIMVVYLPASAKTISIGTMVEIGWASALDIPIIGIIPFGEWGIHQHPFLDELFTFQVRTVYEAAQILKTLLLP